ncbi:N-acetylmuramoyl-L-alanine amidase [Consotaella salsifontis]|uniref:N-acetylmuramoyl-L-alanine amidase n=1 Tax=Consotaella salsifontis TaxID=1365950 RepID=A0A1T4LQR9_9HYPH|nr:N-acetylmuramoyl-L-alanine amidase [Consotaella salsifontis]SJZ57023.1 N-acetylmuramoyl-L-alanine amidase [Consotaella salsifontis]
MNERTISICGRALKGVLLSMIISVFLALCGAAAASLPAYADEPTIITSLSVATSPEQLTGTFEIKGEAKAHLLLLRHPDRVAIDFPGALSAAREGEVPPNALVSGLRQGLVPPDRYRFLFYLSQPASAELKPTPDKSGLTLTLKPTTEQSFAAAFASQTVRPSAAVATAGAASAAGAAAFTVVIDPGHGGIDTGAIADGGKTLEKTINLQFSKVLRDAMEKTGAINPVLTRDTDVYLPLGERAEFARKQGADLFISVHADSIRYPDLRGATVYTLSTRASDALARQIAASENAADRFAGPEWQADQPEVFDILLDLTRRETEAFSEQYAGILVDTLESHDVRLINNPKRSAGFRVLKAPDVPSVLVELGYLSNDEDEKLLTSSDWQGSTASAIAAATLDFLRHRNAFSGLGQ